MPASSYCFSELITEASSNKMVHIPAMLAHAWSPDEQKRFTEWSGTVSGKPLQARHR